MSTRHVTPLSVSFGFSHWHIEGPQLRGYACVTSLLCSFPLGFHTGRWRGLGFAVVPVLSLDYWPQGKPPRSHREEYPTLAVPGRSLWPQCRSYRGFPNAVEPRPNFRGSMTVRVEAPTTNNTISFWKAYVAGSLKKVKPSGRANRQTQIPRLLYVLHAFAFQASPLEYALFVCAFLFLGFFTVFLFFFFFF